jgi:hypothetical protein
MENLYVLFSGDDGTGVIRQQELFQMFLLLFRLFSFDITACGNLIQTFMKEVTESYRIPALYTCPRLAEFIPLLLTMISGMIPKKSVPYQQIRKSAPGMRMAG